MNKKILDAWQESAKRLAAFAVAEQKMEDYRKSRAGIRRFRYKRFYRLTFHFQNLLFRLGISWHNPFSDECCADFSCCEGKRRKP